MKNALYDDIVNTIYKFYPKNIPFNDTRYKKSREYKNLLIHRNNALLDIDFRQYLKKKLETIFVDYVVSDFIDLNNDTSYCYHILMHKNQSILDDDINLIKILDGIKYELIFVLSYLDNYCYYYILETRFDLYLKKWNFRDKFNDKDFIKIENQFLKLDEIVKLNNFLSDNNYYFISDNFINLVIKDIETELSDFGETKIYSALFSDLLSI